MYVYLRTVRKIHFSIGYMKTKKLIAFLFVLTLCLASCQDDTEIILFSGSELNNESGTCTNAVSSTTLYLNGTPGADIGIANGKGSYSAKSSDETIVTATVTDARLLLNSHDKVGTATITVSDKEGNTVTLPVKVAYGIMSFDCRGERISVAVDNTYWDKEELQEQVRTELASYSFLNGQKYCTLQPENVNTILKENSKGTFFIESENWKVLRKGTYQVKVSDVLTGTPGVAIEFTYDDNKEKHIFFFNPKLNNSSARDIGPTPFVWVEDITITQPVSSVQLPENSKVLNTVYGTIWRLRPSKIE